MKVLIIPEDQTLDGFIIRPVVERVFIDLGRKARVEVPPEPRLCGADSALDEAQLRDIVTKNPMVDLFLLMLDRDCNRQNHVERAAARVQEHAGRLLACLAVEEIEVWMLALHREGLRWSEVRAECDPKERYADPLLDRLGRLGPGRGRKAAMRELGSRWSSLLSLCPEIKDLKDAIGAWLTMTK